MTAAAQPAIGVLVRQVARAVVGVGPILQQFAERLRAAAERHHAPFGGGPRGSR
ncbi:hypothetical protein [Streptomyces luteolus]|uniref:Uncharacterized protein n=1 Tax=Streptomyces luteolus TaxID=3043615 RepID=A0ABT6SSQ4_9ACTN|nr:hypothetical protein [Streptomyces sp. B-S-A12]MDI3418633.1 hypothetical protein [Streptomyces sp. B-S-A12]